MVLAIDGLDPDLVSQFMDQGKLPHMRTLAHQGALRRLETTPSADASAWASFATGTNPGKHGVFGNETRPMRRGPAFWTLAGVAGVRSTVLSVPVTFPPEDVPNGDLLSGWPVPDLRDTPGTYTYFSTEVPQKDNGATLGGGVRRHLRFDGDVATSVLAGPLGLSLPVSIFWNRQGKSATIGIDGTSVRLEQGGWSKWVNVNFGASRFARLVSGPRGMIEFCLMRAGTTLGLYASPVHWRPDRPIAPLSSPPGFSADVFERVGPYRTLGWSDATAALDAGLLDEKAFMDDVDRAFDDRAQIILQRIDSRTWDLLVGEIDAVDHVQHVMWRLMDPAHPAHDRVAATRFGDAIERMYRRADAFLGDLVRHAGADAVVLVASVYGGHGVRQTVDLNRWLALEQLPGTATATGAGGIILGPDAHGVEDHLVARLTALLDPVTRAPVISAVYKRESVYAGPYVSNAPDLQVGFAPGYGIGSTSTVFAPNKSRWSADHATLDYRTVPGTLMSSRPTMKQHPRVIDLAPTVLRYFGVPIPTETDGTPLF